MMLASILLALVMERPLMFFTDQPGRLPASNVNAPSETLRITPAHYAELYGVASAYIERYWKGGGVYTNDNWESYIDPQNVQFQHLPIAWFSWGGYDPGYFSPSNRVIKSYRIAAKTGSDDAPVLHNIANWIFNDDYFSPSSGSSLIQDSDPPTFDWCENPFAAVGTNEWIGAWRRFINVTNDIAASTWNLGPSDWYYDDRYSPPGNMVYHLRDLTGDNMPQEIDTLSWELWDAIANRGASETISTLMRRAVPGCAAEAVTNRTLRLDRSFLTALESAASLEDTIYTDTMFLSYPAEEFIYENVYSEGGTAPGTMTVGSDFTAALDSVPSVSGGPQYSVATNSVHGDGPIRYSVLFAQAQEAKWDIAAGAPIQVAGSNLLAVAMHIPDSQWVALEESRAGTAITWTAPGVAESVSVDVAGSRACSVSAGASASRSATVIKSDLTRDYFYYWVPGDGNNLYWRNRRISADVCYQEGMRWSLSSNDVAKSDAYNHYRELDPYSAGGAYRGQKIRQRLAKLGTVSLDYYTNRVHNAAVGLAGECLSKCNELAGCDINDPADTCKITAADLAQARADMSAAAGQPAPAGVQTYTIQLYRHPQGDCYVSINFGSSRIIPDRMYTFGTVNASWSGMSTFAPASEHTPARVDGDMGTVSRFRTKYYNLSNLGE